MRHFIRIPSVPALQASSTLRAALCLLLGCVVLFPRLASADLDTQNAFVGANVSDGAGLVTIYKQPRGNRIDNKLTYQGKSFLTLKIEGKYYSNNSYGGKIQGSADHGIDVQLDNAVNSQDADTIRSLWPESGFDIEQDVYPVAFSISGVVVISVKIINHGATFLSTQVQYLLDNLNTDGQYGGANDNPYLIDRYGYFRSWLNTPSVGNPLPSFYLAFEYQPSSPKLGTVGIGYINDQYPPRPIGLTPVSSLQFGDWVTMTDYTWGMAPQTPSFADEATLMIGPGGLSAHPNAPGAYDSITEVMRIAYGTPEWCFVHGNMVGFALYPHHLIWNALRKTYTPNPFQVETFLFNTTPVTAGNVTIRQTVQDPIRIVNPKPTGLSRDTTQMQSLGSLAGWDPSSSGGFANFRWTDSAITLASGCAASFPVDVHFDVTANSIDQPVFTTPWDCTITVDCANPDIIPPTFVNSFKGCDSIRFDTITVMDNGPADLGLQNITYSSPDLAASKYTVALAQSPPYACIKTPVKAFVQQIDTFRNGHVIFTLTDCANNVSYDTLCFTAHAPQPDLTAPQFWVDSAVADCHAQCTKLDVTDTQASVQSVDRGIDSIVIVSATNMSPSVLPVGGKYPDGTPTTTIHVCVTDSMLDGKIILKATDTAHNANYDTLSYCTTPDTKAPLIGQQPFDAVSNLWRIHITDTQSWDRGIDSVWLDDTANVVTVPATIPYPIGCKRTFDLIVQIADPTKCARATIHAKDCKGNIATAVPVAFSKSGKPVITASKTVLCSTADSAVLDAGGKYALYKWSSGQTSKVITVGPGTYTVQVDDGEGCTATSDPITVTISPATPVIAPPGPFVLCSPNTVTLDAGAGFVSYEWRKDGTPIPGATSQTTIAGTTGSYTAQVTNAAGCTGTSTAVAVTINPLPTLPVITSANNVLTSTPATTYQWFLNGTAIPGATSQSFTPTSGGVFTVAITDANGCAATSLPLSNSGSTVIGVPAMILAKESEHVTIPLSIVSSLNVPQSISRKYTAVLRVNKTLLVPDAGSFVSTSVQGDDLVITYTGTTDSTTGKLQDLQFTAALGDDSCTTVGIDNFSWSTPNITVTTQNGNFCLSGLCLQGGTRLIAPEAKVSMSAPRPNPTANSIEIDYKLIEHGLTSIIIYDLLGREVLRLLDGDQRPGTYSMSADLSGLPAGSYIYSLRTPTIVKSLHLQIAR